MSNLQAVTKVADQLISRLFDQQHFTSGEINYLAKEIGEKVNPEEKLETALKINQDSCVIADTYGSLCKTSDQLAQDVKEKVDRILKIEEEKRENEEKLLAKIRADRDRIKKETLDHVNLKLEELCKTLHDEEIELERKYLKFEDNLRNKSR